MKSKAWETIDWGKPIFKVISMDIYIRLVKLHAFSAQPTFKTQNSKCNILTMGKKIPRQAHKV